MTRRTVWGALVVLLAALPVGAAEVVPGDAGGCPVAEAWAVPTELVDTAGAAATAVPLIPDDAMLACDVVVDCGVHFQEVLPLPAEVGTVTLDGLRFRLDEATPLSAVDAVNCWTVEVSLGVYPYALDDVSANFALNTAVPPTVVYEGPICLEQAAEPTAPGLGEELVVPFEAPVVFDATTGSLLVDVTVDGVAGYSGDVLLDATTAPEVVTVVSLEGPDAPVGEVFPGGPVIILDGVEGPVQPADPRDCLAELDIPDSVRTRLYGILDISEAAADAGWPWIADRTMGTYHRFVDRYENRGVISAEAADKAHEYGSRAGGGFMGPYVIADALQDLAGIRPVLTVFGLEGLVADQIPEGSRAFDLIDDMNRLLREILLDGVVDSADREDVDDWRRLFRRFMSDVWRDVSWEVRGLLRESWGFIKDFFRRYANDPGFRFLVDLWGVTYDGVITQDEAGALKDLRKQLIELLKGMDERDAVAQALKNLPYLLHQLAAKLEKGEISSITVSPSGAGIGFGIATKDPIWIKLFEHTVSDKADYLAGETISIFVRVSKASVTWISTDDGHEILIGGATASDGLSININVTDWWTVLIWEWTLGIDLDDLRINRVVLTGQSGEKVVIEATSDDGEPVRIELENGNIKVEVNGAQVYP